MLASFLCAAISYPKKARDGLPWKSGYTPSQPGGWFHHRVNDWVENVRANTRLWSCFLAFVVLAEFIVICALVVLT